MLGLSNENLIVSFENQTPKNHDSLSGRFSSVRGHGPRWKNDTGLEAQETC